MCQSSNEHTLLLQIKDIVEKGEAEYGSAEVRLELIRELVSYMEDES